MSVVGLCKQEAELKDEIQKVVREKELLSHSLEDRNAELQLQISKTSVSHPMLVIAIIVSCYKKVQCKHSLLSIDFHMHVHAPVSF